MFGTIILFSVLFIIVAICVVYAKEDPLDSYEHKREMLELKKHFYTLKKQYYKDDNRIPFNEEGYIKYNPKTKQWNKM